MSKLPRRTLLSYAATDLPIAMSIFPVLVFIPNFYSDELGLSLTAVSTILLVVRIMDFVTDPLMGYISDHTRSPFGRRKPWIFASTPILMLAIYQLFLPPADVGVWHLFAWMALLSIGTTMMLIPYYAWGAELSTDFHERSVITGWRAAMNALGSLLAQLGPVLVLLIFGLGGSEVVLEVVGTTMLVLMPIAVALTLTQVKESSYYVSSVMPVIQGFKLMLKNGPFGRLLAAFFISSVGLNITTPLYIFFIGDVLNAKDQAVYMLLIFYVSNVCSIPAWVRLSKHIDKHRAYIAAFGIIAFAHPCYLLLGEGDFWYMMPITILTGIAAGGFSQSMPNSMKADVIDLDTAMSGENRSAQFFSAWSFIQKLAAAVGGAIGLYGIAMFGFVPGGNNGPDEIFSLRFMFSTFPSIFFIGAAIIVWRYPITNERHAEIRAQIDAQSAAAQSAN